MSPASQLVGGSVNNTFLAASPAAAGAANDSFLEQQATRLVTPPHEEIKMTTETEKAGGAAGQLTINIALYTHKSPESHHSIL